MTIRLKEVAEGKTLEVHVIGKVARSDYKRFVPKYERLVKRHGKINVLLDMNNFHGGDTRALWDDIKRDYRHFADMKRVAMVGDRTWEKEIGFFRWPFTTAAIRFFDRDKMDAARAWLKSA